MKQKRCLTMLICLALLLGAAAPFALAEGEEAGGDGTAATAEPAPDMETATDAAEAGEPAAAASDEAVDAALCARLLRADEDSAEFTSWLRTLAHIPHTRARQKVGRAVLACALGLSSATPVSDSLYLVPCAEAPLPSNDVNLYSRQHYNLHGAIYSDSPITSVTVSVTNRAITGGSLYPIEATVSFDAADQRTAYALDETTDEGESLSEQMRFDRCRAGTTNGKHTIRILVTTAAQTEPVTVYEANFTVLDERPVLTSNAFRDNYSTALRFFGGDSSKFLMQYTWRSSGKRDIYTNAEWREANIVNSSLGRVHVDAVENFEMASEYLETTYLRVNVNGAEGKVLQLDELVAKYATYVPRFQSNLRLISHHTFGTAIDVNDRYGANGNSADNWEVIGPEVRDCLVYNGIQADESGRQYYDFSYTGDYSPKTDGIPQSIINYLLYELAFFRAGFNWGYYYDHTCDAMHFSLTDGEHYRHMDSETGLRKVFEYYN
ncbi:MAG: M15 family metallopeptidase [Clostridia bacterium]|nr:M15 family metallopeptidase [Clostridia bacterium]